MVLLEPTMVKHPYEQNWSNRHIPVKDSVSSQLAHHASMRSRGPDQSPGQGHCVVFLGKTFINLTVLLSSSLHPAL